MKSIYFAVLMMPGLVFAQSTVAEFDKLLNSSGLCQGITSKFLQSADQQGLDSAETKTLKNYAKQQGIDHARVQTRFIQKYINFLNTTKPGHGVTVQLLKDRTDQLALKGGQADFSANELSGKISSCAESIRAYYPYMFLYENPNDERIRDAKSPLNRVATYFGSFVQCAAIMQKAYVSNGGENIEALKRARSNLAQWYKIFPKYIKDKLPAAGEDEILEYREVFYNSMLLLTQIQWHKLDSAAQKQQVQACINLDEDVQDFGRSK